MNVYYRKIPSTTLGVARTPVFILRVWARGEIQGGKNPAPQIQGGNSPPEGGNFSPLRGDFEKH